jgi:hypothetical protein
MQNPAGQNFDQSRTAGEAVSRITWPDNCKTWLDNKYDQSRTAIDAVNCKTWRDKILNSHVPQLRQTFAKQSR